MVTNLIFENLALLPKLPWLGIIIGAVTAYLFGWLWYSIWFQKKCMKLIENKKEGTNWLAMATQFIGLLLLSYLIGIFSIHSEAFLLSIDALLGITVFLTLAGVLFQRGNNRRALQFWLITAGYEVVAIILMALLIMAFS